METEERKSFDAAKVARLKKLAHAWRERKPPFSKSELTELITLLDQFSVLPGIKCRCGNDLVFLESGLCFTCLHRDVRFELRHGWK